MTLLGGIRFNFDPATIITALVALAASIAGWLKAAGAGRRVDTVWQVQIDSWRTLVTELRADLHDSRDRIEVLTNDNSRLRTENIGLRRGWHQLPGAGGAPPPPPAPDLPTPPRSTP